MLDLFAIGRTDNSLQCQCLFAQLNLLKNLNLCTKNNRFRFCWTDFRQTHDRETNTMYAQLRLSK